MPLLWPRRLTDGTLYNVFNPAGYSPHVDALTTGRHTTVLNEAMTVVIATSPPGSPTWRRRHYDVGVQNPSTVPSVAGDSRPGSTAGGAPPMTSSPAPATPGTARGGSASAGRPATTNSSTTPGRAGVDSSGSPGSGAGLVKEGALRYSRPPTVQSTQRSY